MSARRRRFGLPYARPLMDPLYELASKLLQLLDPEWGAPPVRRRTAARRFQRLRALLRPFSGRHHDRSHGRPSMFSWLRRARRRHVAIVPPLAHASASDGVRATIRRLLEAQGQWAPAPTSIHLRRIIVTRALYDCPELALTRRAAGPPVPALLRRAGPRPGGGSGRRRRHVRARWWPRATPASASPAPRSAVARRHRRSAGHRFPVRRRGGRCAADAAAVLARAVR